MSEEDNELEELRNKKLLEMQMQQEAALQQQQAAEEKAVAEYMDELKGKTGEAQQVLKSAQSREIDILAEIYPDADYSEGREDEASIESIDAWKTLRLIGQGNVPEAGKLLIETAEAAARMPGMDQAAGMERIDALRMYLTTVTPGDADAMDFLADTAQKIYGLRKGAD